MRVSDRSRVALRTCVAAEILSGYVAAIDSERRARCHKVARHLRAR